jgi:putative transposase
MPRKPRIQVANGLYHVTSRAVHDQLLFEDTTERLLLLLGLGIVVRRFRWRCLAYCLMGTHFHLLVRTLAPNISRGMQHLNGRFAQRVNERRDRAGHLLGTRFGSALIESERHAIATVRYLALNPVRANLCAHPTDWRWSSYAAAIGAAPRPGLLDVRGLLELMAQPDPVKALRRLVELSPS